MKRNVKIQFTFLFFFFFSYHTVKRIIKNRLLVFLLQVCVSREVLLAVIVNKLEEYLDNFEMHGFAPFQGLIYFSINLA
jgi:hypothetical protein